MEDNKEYGLVNGDASCIVSEPHASWGGAWTEEKLDALEKYVRAYLTIMKKYAKVNGWKLFYFDAFAGSGSREVASHEEKIIDNILFKDEELEMITEQASYKGAAERIMGLDVDGFSFDYFYFIDKDKKSLHTLQERLRSLFPHKVPYMAFKHGDANEKILELVKYAKTNPKCAALVLLDPFGMQLNWETIRALKGIKHIDLWILVPSGVIINRLLTRSGKILCPERMEKAFGLSREDLQKYFYEQITELGIFGEMTCQKKRDDTINRIAQLYIELLSNEFQFVIKEPLVLRNSTTCPIFHFIFASHNQNGVKIASQIVGKKNRK